MEPVTVGNFLVERKLAAITGSTIWVFGSFPANLSFETQLESSGRNPILTFASH